MEREELESRNREIPKIKMAEFTWDFYTVIAGHEGGYQCYIDDAANYDSKGRLIGTNLGISAIALEQYYKQFKGIYLTTEPVDEVITTLKALTPQDAFTIFKSLYWDAINGDCFANESIAHIVFDWYIASCNYGIEWMQGCLKTIGINVTVDTLLTKEEVGMINDYPNQEYLFNFIKSERLKFVDYIIQKNPALAKFKDDWTRRINSYLFSA